MFQFTKTVYSIAYPKTKEIFNTIVNDKFTAIYEETWTKKQDNFHEELFTEWIKWSNPKVINDYSLFKYQYPTAGSSEAIREQICYLNSLGKRLVVFDGEYEGYIAIANAINMPILKLNRFSGFQHLQKQLLYLNSKIDVFFISQPSAISGCIWHDFNLFLQETEKLNIPIYVDLTYVGACSQIEPINLHYSNIEGIFFSLSKIFGVYYHRIGGVFLKNQNPLLYGNMWFKNLLSIKYGIELLKNTKIGFMDMELKKIQKNICKNLSLEHNIDFTPTDVFLLCNVNYNPEKHLWQKDFQRCELNPKLRLCISPLIEKLLNNEKYSNN